MSNWRTNLGGAISITGTSLIGIGVLTQLTQLSPDAASMLSPAVYKLMWYAAFVGFVLSAVGKGVTALFAADAKSVKNLQEQINMVPKAIDTGDTSMLYKTQLEQKPSTTDAPKTT
jgi:hypothetical protein